MTYRVNMSDAISGIIRDNLRRLSLIDLESLNAKNNLKEFVSIFTNTNRSRQELMNSIANKAAQIATTMERQHQEALEAVRISENARRLQSLRTPQGGRDAINAGQANVVPAEGAPVVVLPILQGAVQGV